jgi:hypothetical protein
MTAYLSGDNRACPGENRACPGENRACPGENREKKIVFLFSLMQIYLL